MIGLWSAFLLIAQAGAGGAGGKEAATDPGGGSPGDAAGVGSGDGGGTGSDPFGWPILETWNAWPAGLRTVVALALFLLVFSLFRRLIVRRLERAAARTENDLDDRVVHFVKQFYGIGMFFLLLLWLLGIWGIEITPLLAGAGIVGISLGFAAKEFIADVLAGVFLITDRPMTVGDRVNVERIGSDWGSWGDVVDIGLRRTQIRNTDGVVVNYPNAILSNSVITNFSHEPHPLRVRVRFAVSLAADLPRAMELTRAAVQEVEGVLADTADVVLRSIWDQQRGVLLSGALLEARYRVADVRERTRIRSRVLLAVVAAMKSEGIAMPELPAGGNSRESSGDAS